MFLPISKPRQSEPCGGTAKTRNMALSLVRCKNFAGVLAAYTGERPFQWSRCAPLLQIDAASSSAGYQDHERGEEHFELPVDICPASRGRVLWCVVWCPVPRAARCTSTTPCPLPPHCPCPSYVSNHKIAAAEQPPVSSPSLPGQRADQHLPCRTVGALPSSLTVLCAIDLFSSLPRGFFWHTSSRPAPQPLGTAMPLRHCLP